MHSAPKGLRLHIGIFGRRNVGKSSILNALVRQQISIVSSVAGTTTDPVEKAMELQPIGPVLFVDTAGIDETSELGLQRVEKTRQVLARTDVAILVTDAWSPYEETLLALFRERSLPCVVAWNKCDGRPAPDPASLPGLEGTSLCAVSALTGSGMSDLRARVVDLTPDSVLNAPTIVGDLVDAGDLVILVVPIDKEAPKGRLILPQVQTIRDLLDHDASALVVKERELAVTLARLGTEPRLVITDSQEFLKVTADVPSHIPVTSFSILFSRFKGDLAAAVRGAMTIDRLSPGDPVLIAEACTHHPVGEDIGRVKIPRWLEQYVGGKLAFDTFSGPDFPENLGHYSLVIHCGGCVMNRRMMLDRLRRCQDAGVPITNYGLSIAYSLGTFDRALQPFPALWEQYRTWKEQERAGTAISD